MTKEEAKTEILQFSNKFNDLDWDTQDELIALVDGRIDEIYDDFESRSCEACVHFDKIGTTGICKKDDYINCANTTVSYDFCCNKWESAK